MGEQSKRCKAQRKRRYEQTREQKIAYSKAWIAANPDKFRSYVRKSNHRRRGVPFTDTGKEYVDVLVNDPCSYCGGPAGSIDHITAVFRGGDSDWNNLTSACHSCNASKSTATLLDAVLRLTVRAES